MKNLSLIVIPLVLLHFFSHAQDWKLKLRSNVELRTWKLTSKAEKKEKSLGGAAIALYKGAAVIGQTTSDENGDFEIDVPGHGDFILTVSFGGCNTKKFYVSTNGVPENVGKDNYKPTVSIGGFVMSKPITGVDYIGLNEPLVKVEYKEGGQNFDKDEAVTNKGLNIVSKISSDEGAIVEKFCNYNKLGDEALNKKKCQIAKEYYTKARAMMPDETYPKEQLLKAEECLNDKKAAEEIAAEAAAKKAEAAKLANEKAIKEKEAKNNASFQKAAVTNTAPKETKTENPSSVKPITASGETNNKKTAEGNSGGKSKRKMPMVIGTDKYKETINKADDYFKTKRYKEAKSEYESALKLREKDDYANKKIAECDILLNPNFKGN